MRQRRLDMASPFADRWAWIEEEIAHRSERAGLWLDSSRLTPEETVREILGRLPEAHVAAD